MPIKLKVIIEKEGIAPSAFMKAFGEMHGKTISKASLSLLLNKGLEMRRIPDFRNKVATVLERLSGRKYIAEDLFKNTKEEEKMYENITLTPEAMAHFGLNRDPFMPYITKESDIAMLGTHLFALNLVKVAAEDGYLAALHGEPGTGKSTVLQKFEEENLRTSRYQIIRTETREIEKITTREILTAIVLDLSKDKPLRNMEALNRQVKDLLLKQHKQGKKCVLIIEDAQDLHWKTMKYFKRLWEMREGVSQLLAIILVGQTELYEKLWGRGSADLREVSGRVMPIPLNAINNELGQYLNHKFKCVGVTDIKKIITLEAIEVLSQNLSRKDRNGKIEMVAYPLEVNNRMKHLLNIAAETGEEKITPEVLAMAGM